MSWATGAEIMQVVSILEVAEVVEPRWLEVEPLSIVVAAAVKVI
jgi:hypothetical protein